MCQYKKETKSIVCVSENKRGQCPIPEALEETSENMCQTDNDCKGNFKCCPSTKSLTCASELKKIKHKKVFLKI